MENRFWLRVTTTEQEKLLSFLQSQAGGWLACQEFGTMGAEHYHSIYYGTRSMSTVRKAFRKVFDLPSAAYSMSKIDDTEGAERYVCKGTQKDQQPTIIINDPEIDTQIRHDQYWAIFENTKASRNAKYEQAKKNKNHKDDFIQEVISEFSDGRWKNDDDEYFVTPLQILSFYQKWVRDNDLRPIGRGSLDSVVLYLINILDNEFPGYQQEIFLQYYSSFKS